MRRSIIFSLVLITFACASTKSTVETGLVGNWIGFGLDDTGALWPMEVKISDSEVSIDYPTLECGGISAILETKGDSIEFIENITYGTRCVPSGRIVITKFGDSLAQYIWYYPDGREGSVGMLKK